MKLFLTMSCIEAHHWSQSSKRCRPITDLYIDWGRFQPGQTWKSIVTFVFTQHQQKSDTPASAFTRVLPKQNLSQLQVDHPLVSRKGFKRTSAGRDGSANVQVVVQEHNQRLLSIFTWSGLPPQQLKSIDVGAMNPKLQSLCSKHTVTAD